MPRISCEIHGADVECLINGKCLQCFKIKEQKEIDLLNADKLLEFKEKSSIPKRYYSATFENYIPSCEKSNLLLEFCRNYDYKSNLLLLGNTGTGKTHLACAIITDAFKHKIEALYIKFYKLADIKIRQQKLFNDILSCDLLVIDEYGQQDSDFKNGLLFEIIDERYDNCVSTIIISNLSPDKFKLSLSAPLYSRIKENVILKSCDWIDYRLEKAKGCVK